MPAYLIADVHVKDVAAFDAYKGGAAESVARHGGKFLSSAGATVALEGGWQPGRMVLVEFPDMAALQAWYNSSDYAPLLAQRLACSDGRLIGLAGT